MRNRKANEATVNKTFSFLENLQDKCEGGVYKDFTTSQLHARNFISNSTFSACVDIGIVKHSKDGMEWLKENPNREMCLQIMDYILHKRKTTKYTAIAGLDETNAVLRKLSEVVTNYVTRREHALKQPQIASNGNLFAEVDTKQDLINKAAFAIAGGIYADPNTDSNKISEINKVVVFAAKDLVNQLLKK